MSIAPGIERAMRERDAMLEWWDAPPEQRDPRDVRLRDLIARLALEDSGKRRASDERAQRFALKVCGAYAVARMDAASAGGANPTSHFVQQPLCRTLEPSDVARLAVGLAVLWERLP